MIWSRKLFGVFAQKILKQCNAGWWASGWPRWVELKCLVWFRLSLWKRTGEESEREEMGVCKGKGCFLRAYCLYTSVGRYSCFEEACGKINRESVFDNPDLNLSGKSEKTSVLGRSIAVWMYLLLWPITIHWLPDTQITFQNCRLHGFVDYPWTRGFLLIFCEIHVRIIGKCL